MSTPEPRHPDLDHPGDPSTDRLPDPAQPDPARLDPVRPDHLGDPAGVGQPGGPAQPGGPGPDPRAGQPSGPGGADLGPGDGPRGGPADAGLQEPGHPAPGHPDAGLGGGAQAAADDRQPERLIDPARATELSNRWDALKGGFVDEPRHAVAQADVLVGELLDEVERLFREQRRSLEHGLSAEEASTEDLRLAFRRYRSFFDRLLSF